MKYGRFFPLSLKMLLVAMAVMMTVAVWGQDVKIKNLERLKLMTSEELIHKGERCRMKKNMPDSALLYLTIVANRQLSRMDEKDTIEVMSHIAALHGLGILYSGAYFDYKKAYGYYLQAESMAKKYNRTLLLPSIHHNMLGLKKLDFSVNRRDEIIPELINDYKQLVREAVGYHAMMYYPIYVANMASFAMNSEMVDSVKPELEKYLKMKLPESKLFPQEVYRLICLAILAYSNKEYEKAFMYLDQQKEVILQNSNDSNFHAWLTGNNYTRCEFLWGMGRDEEGLALVQENLRLGQQADNHVTICDAYNNLMDYYHEHGDEPLANHYELLYLREKNYIENQNHLLDVDKVKYLFEIDKMNEDAKVQAEREQVKTYALWMVCFFTFFIIVSLVLLYRNYREVKEKNAQLFQKVQEQLAEIEEKKALLLQAPQPLPQVEKPKYQKNAIDETTKSELLHRIFFVMESSADTVTNPPPSSATRWKRFVPACEHVLTLPVGAPSGRIRRLLAPCATARLDAAGDFVSACAPWLSHFPAMVTASPPESGAAKSRTASADALATISHFVRKTSMLTF